jgi:hypothetical protein
MGAIGSTYGGPITPSPLAGEGRGGGTHDIRRVFIPLTLTLPRKGGGKVANEVR